DRGGRPELRSHICDDMPVHRRELSEAGTIIFDDASEAALQTVSAQHFENDVLGTDPWRQLTAEFHAHDGRHSQTRGVAHQRKRHTHSAGTEGEHTERAGGGAVAVGADQGLARFAEALHVGGMADAVSRTAVPDAEAAAGGTQKEVLFA